jgi:hypothetical protein
MQVLERIMDAELEILIGLGSKICRVIPEDFARELEGGQIKERFVKRLVDVLNANMEPSADCPGTRRVILEGASHQLDGVRQELLQRSSHEDEGGTVHCGRDGL